MFRRRQTRTRTQEKGHSCGNKSESWRLPSTRSCKMSLERDQLLPTAPEVSFEIAITLACSWLIVLYLYCCFLCAIDQYCRHCHSCHVSKIPFAWVRGYKIE